MNLYQHYAARRMFSRWAPLYETEVADNGYSAADEVAKSAIKHLARADAPEPGITDIGIGTGLLAQQIYDAIPCRITGLDFTEDMMAVCAAREITELLIKCDVGADTWPLADVSQDAVLAAGLFEYLTPDMVRHFFSEATRVLRQDGILVFTYIPYAAGGKKTSFWRGHSGTYLTCSNAPAELEASLERYGYAVLEHSPPFKGCGYSDGSSYDYRLIAAQKK